jgi:hypothetical protein
MKAQTQEKQSVEESTLTKRELSILKQGKQLVTEEQYAVCYLTAKCQLKNRTPEFGIYNKNLAAECGMNPETFRRLVEKFTMLFDGRSEDPYFDKFYMYKKLYDQFNVFIELSDEDAYNIAERSFTEENRNIGYEMAMEKAEQQDKYAAEYKKRDTEIKNKVTLLFNSLNSVFKDATKAKRQAINKVANESNVSVDRVLGIWNKDEMLKKIS